MNTAAFVYMLVLTVKIGNGVAVTPLPVMFVTEELCHKTGERWAQADARGYRHNSYKCLPVEK